MNGKRFRINAAGWAVVLAAMAMVFLLGKEDFVTAIWSGVVYGILGAVVFAFLVEIFDPCISVKITDEREIARLKAIHPVVAGLRMGGNAVDPSHLIFGDLEMQYNQEGLVIKGSKFRIRHLMRRMKYKLGG